MFFSATRRLRTTVRACFLALIAAALLLPYLAIQEQKERSAENYQALRQARTEQLLARLTTPAGEMVLFNPERLEPNAPLLRPVSLPFREVQADDPRKVVDMFESLGCMVRFQDPTTLKTKGAICAAVGREVAGSSARIYVAGYFVSGPLVPHVLPPNSNLKAVVPVAKSIPDAHRIRLDLSAGGETYKWVLPVQARIDGKTGELEPRLQMSAYRLMSEPTKSLERVFSGAWIAQGECLDVEGTDSHNASCIRQTLFSIAIPRDKWGEAFTGSLKQVQLTASIFSPGTQGAPILRSNALEEARLPLSREDLMELLRPGEKLSVLRRDRSGGGGEVVGVEMSEANLYGSMGGHGLRLGHFILDSLSTTANAEGTQTLVKRFERREVPFELHLQSRTARADNLLADSAARMAIYAALMLVAIIAAWTTMEIGIVRRVLRLTKRTAAVSRVVRKDGDLEIFDFSDLRGKDELGVLAAGIDDLLKRIGEDVQREAKRVDEERQREALRTEHDRSMLHAIGHEIRSPLQSLDAALPKELKSERDIEISRQVKRMLRAVKNLYGVASPSAGFDGAEMDFELFDLAEFMLRLVQNAPTVGFENVVYEGPSSGVMVLADPAGLADAVMHVLTNAKRYQPKGSPIKVILEVETEAAEVTIHNQGERIPVDLIERIFEYGVSDRPGSGEGNHGQGLYVTKTYLAKMGAAIAAFNRDDGVAFVIRIPSAS